VRERKGGRSLLKVSWGKKRLDKMYPCTWVLLGLKGRHGGTTRESIFRISPRASYVATSSEGEELVTLAEEETIKELIFPEGRVYRSLAAGIYKNAKCTAGRMSCSRTRILYALNTDPLWNKSNLPLLAHAFLWCLCVLRQEKATFHLFFGSTSSLLVSFRVHDSKARFWGQI